MTGKYQSETDAVVDCFLPFVCKSHQSCLKSKVQPMSIFRKLVFSIVISVIISAHAKAEESSDKLKIILRYDDYSNFTSMEVAESFIDAAKSVGAGVLVGVIPFPYDDYPDSYVPGTVLPPLLSQEKLALLKKHVTDGTIEIAVHGYSHENNVSGGRKSEFSGLPENKQVLLLRMAKESLESATGARIRAFVPPFNQYDATTLKALQDTGFEILSAGMESYSQTDAGLMFLPGTAYIDQLKDVVSSCLSKGHTDAAVVVTVHPYDIVESGEKLPEFRKGRGQVSMQSINDELKQIVKSDAVQPSSIGMLLDSGEDLSIERWKANLRLKMSEITRYRIIPDVFGFYPMAGLYYSRHAAEKMYSNQLWSAAVLYGGLVLVTAIITRVFMLRINRQYTSIRVFIGGAALFGIAGIVTLTLFGGFHTIFAPALACGLGMFTGSLAFGLSHTEA